MQRSPMRFYLLKEFILRIPGFRSNRNRGNLKPNRVSLKINSRVPILGWGCPCDIYLILNLEKDNICVKYALPTWDWRSASTGRYIPVRHLPVTLKNCKKDSTLNWSFLEPATKLDPSISSVRCLDSRSMDILWQSSLVVPKYLHCDHRVLFPRLFPLLTKMFVFDLTLYLLRHHHSAMD